MGHLVHSFLSQTEYSGYSGLNYSDVFLELPSKLHELYAWEPEFINKIISKTKDEDLFKEYDNIEKRVIRVRDMAYPKKIHITYFVSKLDQDFFSIKEPLESSILEFEQNSIGDILIHNPGDELGYSYQVPHLVAPGYASAYYTYLISEIMGFDAFQKFQEAGLFNKEAAEKFRKEFLSKGPTEDIEQLYINFMGHPLSTAGIINYLDSIDFKE
jgi:peptidyl-dipeptidase Dcp